MTTNLLMDRVKEIHEDVKCINEKSTNAAIDIAGIKEHLESLNGTVLRHESAIGNNSTAVSDLKVTNARNAGLISVIISIVISFISKLWR